MDSVQTVLPDFSNKSKNEDTDEPVIIGLAGSSCAGKNTAAEILKKRNWHIIDADEISGNVFAGCRPQLMRLFSEDAKKKKTEICGRDGNLDKKKFARLVFSDKNLLKKLEDFILPEIVFETEKKIDTFRKKIPAAPIVLNAPTLHKTKLLKRCLFVLYIDAPFVLRFIRALKRDRLKMKDIFLRFLRQKNFFSQYIFLKADIVKVKNNGSASKLEKKLTEALLKRGF